MFRKLVRAYVIKGCWYLLENEHHLAKSAFLEAQHILYFTGQQRLKLKHYLSPCTAYEIGRVRSATKNLISALICYVDKVKSPIEEVKVYYRKIIPFAQLFFDLKKDFLLSNNTANSADALTDKFIDLNTRIEHIKQLFEAKYLKDFLTPFLLQGYLLICKNQMKIGHVDNQLLENISTLYSEMAENYHEISSYCTGVKEDIDAKKAHKNLKREMLMLANKYKCMLFQNQCVKFIDKCERSWLQDESIKYFIAAVDALEKVHHCLSVNYVNFVNLLCRVGHQINLLFHNQGYSIDQSLCNELVKRLRNLVYIYDEIKTRFISHQHLFSKYDLSVTSINDARLIFIPLIDHYLLNAKNAIQVLSIRIQNSDRPLPKRTTFDPIFSLYLLSSLFPMSTHILDLPPDRMALANTFLDKNLVSDDVTASESRSDANQTAVANKRKAELCESTALPENDGADRNYKQSRLSLS